MADDEWQTVPEKTNKRAHRGGRGGYRGGHNNNNNNNGGFRNRSGSNANQGDTATGWRSNNNIRGAKADNTFQSQSVADRSRSRPRYAPAPAAPAIEATSPVFKLETTNKFSIHVSKGSRARRNDELREFFETRDDDDGEETFDAIADSDLDVSDYESADDQDEATGFAPVPLTVHCSLCTEEQKLNGAVEVAKHLREVHGLALRNVGHMALCMQEYVDAWAEQKQDIGADGEIRERVHRAALDAVLAAQAEERRGAAQKPRKCLFCKHVSDNRADLFRHAYREHNFNIGLPDNLVKVDEFLGILESKLRALQCLYCEKTFTSAAVLRKHMRKKKHFKISAHNRLYDRFYVVNYAEPGRSWEALENEAALDSDADDADRRDDSWADWDDKADMPATALFDNHQCASADECWAYMRAQCGFDINQIRNAANLDFYATVKLINYVRRCSERFVCFACDCQLADRAELVKHVTHMGAEHLVPPSADAGMWTDKDNLRPVIDNDPLLMAFDTDADPADDVADEDATRKRVEESKRELRKKMDAVSLADAVDDAAK
ncbi:hypothetical protein H4R99_000459 [Coemansia sp. RSA 1722]|nr:hypothetical protein LPJ57_000080 [Coemansia sp. RSA 486]KAJ2224067.1 hypothetical protein IWW45_008184 [Coemansia sp. RSA 485]KAJ2606251.1 hypothetical protein H4R99_000459 [Coemansia sp. RSA 1722]